MRILPYFLFFIFSFAQEAEIKEKANKTDVKKSQKSSSKKKKKRKKQSSSRTINYDANNLWDAIKPALGPGVYEEDGKVLFNTGAIFSTSNKYVEWAINGVLMGQYIPLDIEIQDIQDVKVLKSAMETSRYGLRGSAGVIEIILKKD
ncbi:MAG: hypothetical protein P8K14_00650 [Flavobacteriaceae bacterium]|jgi:hypothetical protein|nr:hypothetical protein [Flavobacteriaceae bacterium]